MFIHQNSKFLLFTTVLVASSFSIIYSFDINQKFLLTFSNFLNIGDINITEKSSCMSSITSEFTQRNYIQFLNYSGHSFSELGNRYACKNNGYYYFFLTITKILPEKSDNLEKQLDIFLGVKQENFGFCIHPLCNKTAFNVFNSTGNEKFYNYIRTEYDLSDIEIFGCNESEEYSKTFLILGSIALTYIVIMIILRLISSFLLKGNEEDTHVSNVKIEDDFNDVGQLFKTKKDNKKSQKGNDNNDSFEGASGIQEEQKENSDDEDEINNNNDNKNEPQIKPELNKNNISDDDDNDEGESYESHNSLFERYNNDVSDIGNLEKFISPVEGGNAQKVQAQNVKQSSKPNQIRFAQSTIFHGNFFSSLCNSLNDNIFPNITIKTIFTFQNEMFDSNNVKVLTGMRALILLMMTLFKTFENFYKQPSIGRGTSMFINSLNFGLIKFSSFSYHCFVLLDGINFAFRYMVYTKKNKSCLNVFKLYIKMMLPKMLCFFIIFYFVYFIGNDISMLYGKTAIFNQIYTEINNNYQCLYNPIYFIPGVLSYLPPVDSDKCFSFIYFCINEFICITLMFVLLTILRAIKKPIVDYIISIWVFINILLSFLTFILTDKKHLKYKAYVLELIMGEKLSINFPHLMFNMYFIGMISGLVYFYYLLSMKETSEFMREKYLPFNYCVSIIALFVGKKKFGKYIIIILSILGLIILTFLFQGIKLIKLENKHEMLLDFDLLFKGIYCYEKILFVLMFGIIGTALMVENEQMVFKRFFANKIFFWIERVAFVYLILLDYGSLFIYSLFDVNGIEWDYLFLWFLTAFEMLIMLIVAVLVTVLVELPFRYFVKKIIGKGERDKKKF